MGLEIDRLISYFDGNIDGVRTAAKEATAIVDTLEKRIKNFKSDLKLNINTTRLDTFDQGLSSAKKHTEELQTTFNALRRSIESLNNLKQPQTGANPSNSPIPGNSKEMREALQFQIQSANAERAIEQAKRATLATVREEIKLEADRLRLAKQTEAANGKSPVKATGGSDKEILKAQAEIKKYQQQTAAGEKAITNLVAQQAEQQNRARTKSIQKSAAEFQKELNKIEAAEKRAASQSSSGNGFFAGIFGGNLAAQAVTKLTSTILTGGGAVLDYSAKLEQARIGFISLTGSAAAADQHLRDLQDFAKTTPFDFDGLVKASQLLQGVGVNSQRIIPILSDFGNALAAAGKGNEEIQRTILALSQIASKGKVAGQELNQLSENGISGVSILSQALGKPRAEILKLSESGQISFDLLIAAMHKVVQQNGIGDSMVKQSRTFTGATENIKDSLLQLAQKAFAPLYSEASTLAVGFADEIQAQGNDLEAVGTTISKYIGKGLGLATAEIAKGFGQLLAHELTKSGKDSFLDSFGFSFANEFGAGVAQVLNTAEQKLNFTRPDSDFEENRKKIELNRKKNEDQFFGVTKFQTSLDTTTVSANSLSSSISSIKEATNGITSIATRLDTEKAKRDAREIANTISSISSPILRNTVETERNKGIFGTNLTASPLSLPLAVTNPNPIAQKLPVPITGNNLSIDKTPEQQAKEAEQLTKLQLSQKENYYNIQKAMLAGYLKDTEAQRVRYINREASLDAAYIQLQIAVQTRGFDNRIKLAGDNAEKQTQLETEKNQVLSKLQNDLTVNEIKRNNQLAEEERAGFEKRRQAAIEFKNLIIQESKFNFDNKSFDITQDIERGNVSAEAGFARLKQITQENYEQILQTTRKNLALQLQDKTLTEEQVVNLKKQSSLEERKLAEDNSRALIDIQEQESQAIISRLKEQFDQVQALYRETGNLVGSIAGSFFNPETFSSESNKNFQNIILGKEVQQKADEAFSKYQNFKNSDNSTDSQVSNTLSDFARLEAESEKFKASFKSLPPVIQGVYTVIGNLGNQLSTTAGTYENFDKIAKLSLFARQKTELESFNAEIKLNEQLLQIAKDKYTEGITKEISVKVRRVNEINLKPKGTLDNLEVADLTREIQEANKQLDAFKATGATSSTEIIKLKAVLEQLGIGFKQLETKQAEERIKQARESIKGLEESIRKLKAGDPGALNGVLDLDKKGKLEQQKSTLEHIIALKNQLRGFETGDKDTVDQAKAAAEEQHLEQQVSGHQQLFYLKKQLADYDQTEQVQLQIAAEQQLLELREAGTRQLIEQSRTVQDRIKLTLAQLPSDGTIIKDFFGQLPEGIGNIFQNAVQQWDGTFKGFFKSLGQGFAQLLQQLAADLLKAQIIKLVGSLIGTLGGLFGGAGGGALVGAGAHGFATGGYIQGAGTATSDSIAAQLSNGEFVQQAKAVDFYGVPFMNALNNLQLPRPSEKMKFASGGLVNTGPDIFVPSFNDSSSLRSEERRLGQPRAGGGQIINNNTVNIAQTFPAPRGTIAPKSTKQAQEHALAGVSRALKGRQ